MSVEYPFIRACEIFSSAVCPLSCKYCYIPKTKEMQSIHEELLEKLTDQDLLLPKYTETLGIWGTEPLLILDYLDENFLSSLKKNHKHIKEVSFSTSLILPITPLKNFIGRLNDFDIKLDLQISIDGPPSVTDVNRGEGITAQILKNLWDLLSFIEDNHVPEMTITFKSTLTPENLRYLNSEDNVKDYLDFFNDIQEKAKSFSIPDHVRIFLGASPTIMVPGNYTSEDGKLFCKFIKILHSLDGHTSYDFRLERAIRFLKEFFYKPHQMTCSGGDSNIGYDPRTKRYHLCHRTFFLDDKRYIKSILDMDKYKNWDVSLLETNSLDNIAKNFIVPESGLSKFLYVTRSYHDFPSLRLSITMSLIYELALAGQISSDFLKPELCFIFAIFLQTALSCPMESILVNGSIHTPSISLIRMFGNGAFQEILRYHYARGR